MKAIRSPRSVFTKLLVFFIPTMLVTVFFVTWTVLQISTSYVIKKSKEDLIREAESLRDLVEKQFHDRLGDIELLRDNPVIVWSLKENSYDKSHRLLLGLKNSFKVYSAIELYDSDAKLVSSSSKAMLDFLRVENKHKAGSKRWFLHSINGQRGFDDLHYSDLFRSLIVNFYAPVVDPVSKKPIGVVRFIYAWKNIFNQLERFELVSKRTGLKTKKYYILANDGRLLYHKSKNEILKNFKSLNLPFENLDSEYGSLDLKLPGTNYRSILAYTSSLNQVKNLEKDLKWHFLVVQSRKEILSFIDQIYWRLVFATATITLISSIVLLLMMNRLLSPLTVVSDVMRRIIVTNDYSIKLTPSTTKEINDLIFSFNELTDNLRKTTVTKDFVDGVFHSLDEVVLVIDSEAKILSTNRTTYTLLGYTDSDLDHMNLRSIFSNDKSFDELFIKIKKNKLKNFETKLISKTKSIVDVSISGNLLPHSFGYEKSFVLSATNITEKLKSEKDLKLLASFPQANPGPIMRIDENGIVVALNQSAKNVFPSIVLNATKWDDLSGSSDQRWKMLYRAGGTIEQEIKVDQEVFLLQFHGLPELGYTNIYGVNITQRKELQAQVLQSAKLASIGELAAGVGHEINNPLAIIRGNLDAIIDCVESETIDKSLMNKYLQRQDKSITRIAKIVDGLRTYARLDSEDFERVNVHKIIEESVQLLETIYNKEGIIIEKSLKANHCIIEGVSGKFHQVLMNFFSNSKSALENRVNPLIKISTNDIDDFITISIEDNGIGIKEENIKKIFDSFYTTKPIGKGTGLGLGITASIINDMGGSIDVRSEYERGTEFLITIPTARTQESPVEPRDKEMNKNNGLKGKALLIDDEEDLREVISVYLEKFGLEVVQAANGDEGIRELVKNEFDIILTDLKMPKMSGIEFMSKAKDILGDNCNFIVMTGGVEEFDRIDNNGKLIDKNFLLLKPFTQEELFEKLSIVLGR